MISVVIPTRHRNASLADCLRRLAPGAQTLPAERYEVIVTDDGSDATAEAMVRDQFPWARWMAGPRRGPAANRNHGVVAARGDWIAFVDDDCLPSPGWLAAFSVAALSEGDLFSGKTTCEAGLRYPTPLLAAPYNLDGTRVYSCNLFVEATLYRQKGGFDEGFPHWNEDVDFVDRMKTSGILPHFVPAAIVEHPPRRRELGWTAGLAWESRVMLSYKQGNRTPAWRWLPEHLIKIRIQQIFDCPPSKDSLIAAITLSAELLCVLMNLWRWDRIHRQHLGVSRKQLSGSLVADSDR